MSDVTKNFILGAGEQLVETILPPTKVPTVRAPYTPEEARQRISPRVQQTIIDLRRAPDSALPQGEAVAKITLHPQFLSKSAFPGDLIADAGLRAIGSKETRITPEKVARKSDVREEPTATVFVAGTVAAFERFATKMQGPVESLKVAVRDDLTSVETMGAMMPEDRMLSSDTVRGARTLECILHANRSVGDRGIVDAFEAYAAGLGLRVDRDRQLFASGLCFLSVTGDIESAEELAWFSFLRRIRPMPRMRPLLPTRITKATTGVNVKIPDVDSIDPSLVAAVFDTSLPAQHALNRWVQRFDYGVPEYLDAEERLHGLCVTSAATLGPLDGVVGEVPPFSVHHHGVLGEDPDESGYHQALRTIQETVAKNDYRLINLSFGPDGAIEDDDVDAFTAVVDELLADGKRLCFIAVGNDGELDSALGLNRVQPPSDAVNAISMGATHSRQSAWKRADYSCVGPGRLGCRIKPDLVHFGGSLDEPFGCVGPGTNPDRYNTQGTSFASPSAMRIAGTVIAAMGEQVSAVGVKALLVHAARLEEREPREVGHGLLPSGLAHLLTSDGDEVKILFQGRLVAGKYVRHQIPTPALLQGMVELEATLCFATPVDPNFPSSYVQAGIEATFRPHSEKRGKWKDEDGVEHDSAGAKSVSLFNQKSVYGESHERRDAHLWDTVLKTRKSMRHTSLKDPVIELHYNRRVEGRPSTAADQPDIPYALVLTLRCKAMPDLYNQVRSRYSTSLQVLAPRANVPIRV